MTTISEHLETLEDGEASAREPVSALAVYRFVWGYWRRVPWRLTGMLVGTSLGVVLEVQIPRLSAALVVTTERDQNLWKSFRNFPKVGVRTAAETNSYDLLAHKWVLMQEGAMEIIAGRLPAIGSQLEVEG